MAEKELEKGDVSDPCQELKEMTKNWFGRRTNNQMRGRERRERERERVSCYRAKEVNAGSKNSSSGLL